MRATSDDKSHLSPGVGRRLWTAAVRLAWWPRGRDHWRHPAWPMSPALHPLCLFAALALAMNDWVLKPSTLAGLVTGKLSDAAGLIVAPLWLAALLGFVSLFSRRRLALCIACVGGAFIACKTSPVAADAVASALAMFTNAVGMAAPRIVVDPTDLVTLPALLVAWRIGVDDQRRVPLGTVRAAKRWLERHPDQPQGLARAIGADGMVLSGAARADVDGLVAAMTAANPGHIEAALEKLACL